MNEIVSFAIAYDCLTQKDEQSDKLNAIAVEYHTNNSTNVITYYYPYELINNKIILGEPWAATQ